MGEAWSDWYAFDYLVGTGLTTDTAAQGQVDIGNYSDAQPHATRFQALDCKVGVASNCPGGASTGGPGGFTYADFGKVCCGAGDLRPEVHSDGEIWAETLWDLRDALGQSISEALVTGGMRLSPPEPSFLDMRNAILQADTALYGGSHTDAIWAVFATRGMGYFAASTDGNDVTPVANTQTPADVANLPKGTLSGRVTDQDTGKPIAGAAVGIGGLNTPGFGGGLSTTTAADGSYALAGVPQHTYPSVTVNGGGGYFVGELANVAITGGATTTRDVAVRKSLATGAPLVATDRTGDEYSCGPAGLTDANLGTVWELNLVDSARSTGYQASATVDLGRPTDVYAYGLDPSAGCGSDAPAAARQFRLEASPDGSTWTAAGSGSLDDAVALTQIRPSGAAATRVRFVRLTVTADATHIGYGYLDMAELAVFGHATPTGTLGAAATATANTAVTLDASSFTTDSRAALTRYDWDIDGNGIAERTTTTATTSVTFGGPGTFTPSVTVTDDLGGTGSASASIAVSGGPSPGTGTATTPPTPARPSVRFLKSRTGKARLRVTCAVRCTTRITGVLSKRAARHLGFKRRTLATRTARFTGTRTVELKIAKKTRRAIRRRGVKSIRLALRVVVTSAAPKRTVRRTVRIRM